MNDCIINGKMYHLILLYKSGGNSMLNSCGSFKRFPCHSGSGGLILTVT